MTGFVAAEVAAGGVRLYFHKDAAFESKILPFSPFVLADAAAELPGEPEIKVLDGEGFFCRQAFFSLPEWVPSI